MKRTGLIIFLMAAVSQLVAQFFPDGWLHWISKPLLMLSLAMFYYGSVGNRYSVAIVVAILFSFSGDVFLMLPDVNGMYFMIGLVSFLLAHIFYIFAYRQHCAEMNNFVPLNNIQKIRFSLPFILMGTGLVTILYPGLSALRIPVIIYAIVLVSMVLVALFRYGLTTTASFWLVFGGAFFFMVSDSLLAINKFYTPVALSGIWIMLTYCLAQFMIIYGLKKHQHV